MCDRNHRRSDAHSLARLPAVGPFPYNGFVKVVGIALLALVAFFVIKSILSMLVSLIITVVVVVAAIALISAAVSPRAKG